MSTNEMPTTVSMPQAHLGKAPLHRLHRRLEQDVRSASLLDESRRRVKRNAGEIESLLRLHEGDHHALSSEAVLADMIRQVLSMAAHERAVCRSGQLGAVDLAVYLREIGTFLNRSMGRTGCPDTGFRAGWLVGDSTSEISWMSEPGEVEGETRAPGQEFGDALALLPREWRETLRLAVCACAVVFPPGVFNWRTSSSVHRSSETQPLFSPRDLWIGLRSAGGQWIVDLSVDHRGIGLPRRFESRLRAKMGLELTSVLSRLAEGTLNDHPERARFSVAFVAQEEAASGPVFGSPSVH